jgi:hypothetical protein
MDKFRKAETVIKVTSFNDTKFLSSRITQFNACKGKGKAVPLHAMEALGGEEV